MRYIKYQKGWTIFPFLAGWIAIVFAGHVATNFETDNTILFVVAVLLAFLVPFMPTIFYFIDDQRKESKKKSKSMDQE